ncbi:hypothetical protein FA95DRAFT_1600143 [Auriscalpium vulgare]|uniref:Uncharacterized protein n=1 Tax=Auriscalpium vulgare TaxID=40419 RepID=A0ACB8R3P3_9AGAM|nr:hypothetical protein FA95DRAFT_1600143 [Auriscalpium vulgare]
MTRADGLRSTMRLTPVHPLPDIECFVLKPQTGLSHGGSLPVLVNYDPWFCPPCSTINKGVFDASAPTSFIQIISRKSTACVFGRAYCARRRYPASGSPLSIGSALMMGSTEDPEDVQGPMGQRWSRRGRMRPRSPGHVPGPPRYHHGRRLIQLAQQEQEESRKMECESFREQLNGAELGSCRISFPVAEEGDNRFADFGEDTATVTTA